MTLSVTKDWPPGCYLLSSWAAAASSSSCRSPSATTPPWRPMSCRTASPRGRPTTSGVTTASTTAAPAPGGSNFASRARVVSFDRPYPQTWASGRGRLRGQRAPAAHAPREPGSRPHLLDRRRPARAATAPHEPQVPLQPGPRRVLVPAHAPGRRTGQRRRRQPGLPRRQRLLPPDPPGTDAIGPNRLQVCYKDAAEDPIAAEQPDADHGQLEPGAGQPTPSRRSSGPCTSRSGPRPPMVVTDALVVVLRRLQPERRRTRSPTSSSASTTATSPRCPGRATSTSWRTRPSPGSPTGPT